MPVNIELRIIGIENFDDLIMIWEKSNLHIKPLGRDNYESIEKEMKNDIADFVIAYVDNKPAGSVLVTHDGRKGWINRLAVLPEFRRTGIAGQLLDFAEDILHKKGITIFACLIENWNDVSKEFFRKNGYFLHEISYLTKRDNPDA